MRSFSLFRAITAASVVFAAAACSDASAPAASVTDTEATADLAFAAGDAIATDVGFLIGGEADGISFVTAPAQGVAGSGPRGGTAGCSPGPNGRRHCTATTINNLTHTRSFAFYDASGAIQSSFDATTTASINFQMAVNGTITREGFTATIARERNATLSGLAGTETQRTWNGTGTGSHNGTATGPRGTRTYSSTSKDTTTNVVFILPRVDNPWPASGTIVHSMTATATFEGARSGTRTVSRRALVTFNGTSIVPLVIGDRTCQLNLETKTTSCTPSN